jgi:hypothetical protein
LLDLCLGDSSWRRLRGFISPQLRGRRHSEGMVSIKLDCAVISLQKSMEQTNDRKLYENSSNLNLDPRRQLGVRGTWEGYFFDENVPGELNFVSNNATAR